MSHVVNAEVAATVLSVSVEAGQKVQAEDAVVMLETLKIEIPVLAGVSGTVTEVVVAVGDQVHEDDPLVIIAED
ncbi:MAG TPA: acetyl-CoA carboxylase biotin carboxyl carrier protein subunit [Arachnia sp.]|jgi:acetyl-CoA carboxylase biotin carboxyl carrier protein|nr:acetyl-CoA carboxylase biotin carboxyl carrier protein subunit [Arachnia sp.]